ncbi:MAG: hypothetical protein QOJ75_1916 [Chloroflexota bacterium]|nr:hypothetical protein [Chloroflexota bacterium]
MTQQQIISYGLIALVIIGAFVSLALATYRRRSARTAHASVVAGTLKAIAGASGQGRADGGPTTAMGASAPHPSLTVAGIVDPVLWTRATVAEVARIGRYQRAATIVLVEIDGLDRLIETLGPAAGDRIVAAAAATIRAEARATDSVTRLGPHRFGVLMPETDEATAKNYTERVRANCDRWLQTGAVSLRVAIGWASLTPELGPTGTMHLSQERLDLERRTGQRAGFAAG